MSPLYLPEEVLQHIFSHLKPDLREPYWGPCSSPNDSIYKTLLAVCYANKACYRIAQQYLYHTLEIYGRPNRCQSQQEVSGRPSNLRPVVIHLLRNPKLALEVRNIKVESWRSEAYQSRAEQPPLQEVGGPCDMGSELHELGRQKLREANLSASVAFNIRDAVCKGREDGQLALLLAICPNLEELELSLVQEMDRTRVKALVQDCMELLSVTAKVDLTAAVHCISSTSATSTRAIEEPRPLPFSNLRTLSVRNCSTTHGASSIHVDQIADLFSAPQLEYVRTYGIWYTQRCPYPHTSNIRHLRIDATEISSHALCVVLQANPSLTTLELHNTRTRTESWASPWETLGDALRSSGGNLQTIIIHPRPGFGTESDLLGDLSSLVNLKHLRANRSMIITHNFSDDYEVLKLAEDLPPSLEIVEIARCDDPGETDWQEDRLFQYLDYELAKLLLKPQFTELRRLAVETTRLYVFAECARDGNTWERKPSVERGWVVLERKDSDGHVKEALDEIESRMDC